MHLKKSLIACVLCVCMTATGCGKAGKAKSAAANVGGKKGTGERSAAATAGPQISSGLPQVRKMDAASKAKHFKRLEAIGNAFHSHHSALSSFGTASGNFRGRRAGLSWRVHLLRHLDQDELFKKFRLYEPWDSEHNKKLIAEMPDIFKVDSVDAAGRTSIHVLLGEHAPFGGGETEVGITDFRDGIAYTFLAVMAGPDKADIWTKPGGLELNSDAPAKTFGSTGDSMLALFADGSTHDIDMRIDPALLNALTTHAGREVVDLKSIHWDPQGPPKREPPPLAPKEVSKFSPVLPSVGENKPTKPRVNLDYISPAFAVGFVAKPRQLVQSGLGRMALVAVVEGNTYEQATASFEENYGVSIDQVDQIAVLMLEANFAARVHTKLPPGSPSAQLIRSAEEAPSKRALSFFEPNPMEFPTVVIRTSANINKGKVLAAFGRDFGPRKKASVRGKEYFECGGYAIWFPNDKAVVATQSGWLPEIMSNQNGNSTLRDALAKNSGADFVAVADGSSMPTVRGRMMEELPRMLRPINQVIAAQLVIDGTSSDQPLAHAAVDVVSETSATILSTTLTSLLEMGTKRLAAINNPPDLAASSTTLAETIKNVSIRQRGRMLTYEISKPRDSDRFFNALTPQFEAFGRAMDYPRNAVRRTRFRNNLWKIGTAFHEHHNAYRVFSAADGSLDGRNAGLSWRVHLLPFLEQRKLYAKFKLDEAWDSEHNKKLIAEMPDVFKVEGVGEHGKTSIHVLLGEDAPFQDGTTSLSIDDCVDGTEYTFLTVMAGADKADVWTKPGGLQVDPDNPHATLGTTGEKFLALLVDGAVLDIGTSIKKRILNAMMTHDGGEEIDFTQIPQGPR